MMFARSSWGFIELATATGSELIVAVVLALLVAVVCWLVFHVLAPAYQGVAAALAFVVALLALLFL